MAIVKALILMLVLGALLGGALAFASIKFYVKEDTRVEEVLALLPGYNCGACGNPGCSGMAAKLVAGESKPEQCRPAKPEQRAAIEAYLKENVG